MTDVSKQFVEGNQAKNLSQDRIGSFMERINQLQKDIEQLNEIISKEKVAKEMLDEAKYKHKTWERKMEALELVVNDPEVFED